MSATNIKRMNDYYTGNGVPKPNDFQTVGGLSTNDIYRDLTTNIYYRYANSAFTVTDNPFGVSGTNGISPTISVGATVTLPPGSPATVTPTVTGNNTAFNFGIPEGKQGQPGQGTGGGIQLFDSFYQFYTTTSFQSTILKYFDSVSKMGGGIFQWVPNVNYPTIVGQCVNRGNGCFIRMGNTVYSADWAGTQLLPMNTQANAVSTYGVMTQDMCDTMFGAGYDLTKDTYDFIAANYTFGLLGKVGFSKVQCPPQHVFQVNRTVTLAPYYETLIQPPTIPASTGRMPSDRKTEACMMQIEFNHACFMASNNTAFPLISANITDFSQTNLINRSYILKDGIFFSNNISTAKKADTAISLMCTNASKIINCNFYNFDKSVYASFCMHLLIEGCDFGGIFGDAVTLTYKGISGGSPSQTPCNGAKITHCHFSGETYNSGRYGIVSEETDALLCEHNSFEGHDMTADYYVSANSSTCKGFNIRGSRCEHHLRTAILECNINESNACLETVWSQGNNVICDAIATGSGIVYIKDIKYADGGVHKLRGHAAQQNWSLSELFNAWNLSGIQFQTDLGGIVPNADRVDMFSFRWKNW